MDAYQLAEWIVESFSDRISRKLSQQKWRLDGRVMSIPDIWMQLVYPFVESGKIELEFPQTLSNMHLVFGKIALVRANRDSKAGSGDTLFREETNV